MNLKVFNMKKCNKCSIEKEFCDFYKKSDSKDGYCPTCKECRKHNDKLYYNERKNEILKYQKEYYSNNSEKVKKREKERRKNYSEKIKEYELKRKSLRKKYISEYYTKRRQEDILFKISGNIRNRINKFLNKKSKNTELILGISFDDLKIHLEKQFNNGMSWENYGDWHIDHIIPLSSAKSEEEIYKLCHYENLQPLWSIDNLKKGNRV